MWPFGKKKTFDELMRDFENATGDYEKQAKILQQAAKIAKSDSEKVEVMASMNTLKEKYNL